MYNILPQIQIRKTFLCIGPQLNTKQYNIKKENSTTITNMNNVHSTYNILLIHHDKQLDIRL